MTRHNAKILPVLTWRGAIGNSDLAPVTRHVALALSLYMSEAGDSAHPGAERLAHDTGRHVSTIREHLALLVGSGWLVQVERGGLRGVRRHANVYQAVIPDMPLPLVVDDPSPKPTRRPRRADPSSPPRQPLVVDDPISSGSLQELSKGATDVARTKRKGTRVPDPFTVSDDMVAWAEANVSGFDWKRESSKFLDYWRAKPGQAGVKLDWTATWRNWMRTAAEGRYAR